MEEIISTRTPAKSLPAGWNWQDWNDGSGALLAPDGRARISYDRGPYCLAGGIEFQKAGAWDVFWGGLPEFKFHVEALILESCL